MKKILIIQTAFIGDVILATAMVEKVAQTFPQSRIDFLLRKGNEGLLKNNPHINQVLIWDKKKNKNIGLLKLIGEIREEKYDLVFNLQRFLSSGFLTAFSGADMKIGFDKNPLSFLFSKKVKHVIDSKGGMHEIDRNQLLVGQFGDNVTAKPKLYPSETDFNNTKLYKSEPFICMAPASVWFTKQFPKEKWIEFINTIPEKFNVYLLGGPGDKALCNEIISNSKRSRVEELCGKLSFLESAALMKDAAMNYVNDSAPMHIASAMNASVAAIFCSTVPAFGFGPLSEKSFIVETKEELECRPCGLHGYKKCPEGHFACGYKIENKELLAVIS